MAIWDKLRTVQVDSYAHSLINSVVFLTLIKLFAPNVVIETVICAHSAALIIALIVLSNISDPITSSMVARWLIWFNLGITVVSVLLTGGILSSPLTFGFWMSYSFALTSLVFEEGFLPTFMAAVMILVFGLTIFEKLGILPPMQYPVEMPNLTRFIFLFFFTTSSIVRGSLLRGIVWKAREHRTQVLANNNQFVATMSHEMRTPLTSILGWVDILLNAELNPTIRSQLFEMKLSGHKLLEVINNTLDLAKVEQGGLQLEQIDFDLDELVRLAVDTTRSLLHKDVNINLVLQLPGGSYFRGDPHRITKIISTFLRNAAHFTKSGTIQVFCVEGGRYGVGECAEVIFGVKDCGCGISSDSVRQMFTDLKALGETPEVRFGGRGLGLSVARKLIETMGGMVHVKATPNVGTSITWTLMLDRAKPSEMPEGRQSLETLAAAPPVSATDVPDVGDVEEKEASHCSVLLVEDNIFNQKLIKQLLMTLGCQVVVASDGEEALLKVEQRGGPFDVIFMDVQMPVLDGIDATRSLRERGYRGKIYGLSANCDDLTLSQANTVGMTDFLAKPVSVHTLQRAIRGRNKGQSTP